MNNPDAAGQKEEPVLDMLQQLSDGIMQAEDLTDEQRRRCVAQLRLRGLTYADIAKILKVSDKTIQRDIAKIREQNRADPPSIELMRQIIGDYLIKMEAHHASLVRLARERGGTLAERILAESSAAGILDDMVDRLQSLGYLPERPQQVVGDFVHHIGDSEEPTLANIEQRIIEILTIGQEAGGISPDIAEGVRTLQLKLEALKLEYQVEAMREKQQQEKETNQ